MEEDSREKEDGLSPGVAMGIKETKKRNGKREEKQ